jgi:hypothetical protein
MFAAQRSPHVGAECALGSLAALARRLYLPGEAEVNALLVGAGRAGFFEWRSLQTSVSGLTIKGWELAERLREELRESDQAFVAMWFHAGMDTAFHQGFQPALRACGYNPFRIDQTAHTGKIDDEIIANIRKSRLLVADLTGCRPNVFYEAGFAAGLGRSVLYTCQADYLGHFLRCEPNSPAPPVAESGSWFDQISQHAFDVRQYPVLRWTAPADLATALQARIEALGLSLLL